jgi:hypothetical protein
MVRRVTPAQLKSLQRQALNKHKQAVDRYNREVRKHNQNVKQQAQKINQAIGQYNREVRAYNSRVRSNRQRVQSELAKLNRQSYQPRLSALHISANTLFTTYGSLEQRAETQLLSAEYNQALDFSEQETANSLQVMNSLLDSENEPSESSSDDLRGTGLTDELSSISGDLDARWRGAVFSLHPDNPDAARHFCTSAREVITQILEIKAPDDEVFRWFPDCQRTDRGNATRKAKIKFILSLKGFNDKTFQDFVEQDVADIIELFRVFNDGTHGSAGKFGLQQLAAIKRRVEDGIRFLTGLAQ